MLMSKFVSFKGAVSEVMTPFNEDGSINYNYLKHWVDTQIDSGISGIFTNALASEALLMTFDELNEVNAAVCSYASNRVPVMTNVTGNVLEESLNIIKVHERAGSDAISLTQPMVYGITQEGLYGWLSTLAHSTDLPVCIYNAPQTGNVISPETIARLFRDCENVVYYKESTIDIVHIQNTIRLIGNDKEYEFLAGSDSTTYLISVLGGLGVISLISSVFPKPIVDLCNKALEKDFEKACKIQFDVLKIRDALKVGPFMSGYKYASELMGVPVGVVRKPLVQLSTEEKAKIEKKLKELELI